MARGAIAKEEIFSKILETFEGSFIYNGGKECRIPWDENGTEVQIKVALTCAKDNVNPNGEMIPAAVAKEEDATSNFPAPKTAKESTATFAEPSAEEKQNVEDLLKALGLE